MGLVVAGLFAAAPSASAEKIVFLRTSDTRPQDLWVIRPDGSQARRQTWFGVFQDDPHVAPDGRRLVWAGFNGGIWTSTITGKGRRVVWNVPSPHGPRWSPSGKQIAAVRAVEEPPGWEGGRGRFFQVFVIRPGVGRPRMLRTPVSMFRPDWSPDGRWIVAEGFRSQMTTTTTGLWVINVATGAAREILHSDNDFVGAAAWSPRGRTIAFSKQAAQTESGQVWTVRPDGSGLRQLTRLPGGADWPSWSPDGRRLVITTKRAPTWGSDIATIRADGSGLRLLTNAGNRGHNLQPDWSR